MSCCFSIKNTFFFQGCVWPDGKAIITQKLQTTILAVKALTTGYFRSTANGGVMMAKPPTQSMAAMWPAAVRQDDVEWWLRPHLVIPVRSEIQYKWKCLEGFPGVSDGKKSAYREGDQGLIPVRGEFHGQRSLAGFSPCCLRESDTTQQLTLSLIMKVCCLLTYKNFLNDLAL